MNDEYLIHLVRDRKELYDTNFKLYHDQVKREKAWQDIAKMMKQSAIGCKDRWKRLRDNYRKAKKLRETKKRQGIKKIKKIKHESIIAFIDPMIDLNEKEPTETMEEGDEDSESAESSSEMSKETEEFNEVPLSEASTGPFLVLDGTRSYAEEPQASDTVVSFFTNLGETVKTFPEEILIRVKRDIFKIVNEAEEEAYNRSNSSRTSRNVKLKNEKKQ